MLRFHPALLILLLPAIAAHAADPPRHLADFVQFTLADGKLDAERIRTGNPAIDDGSITEVQLEGLPGTTTINRGVSYVSVLASNAQKEQISLTVTEAKTIAINGWSGPPTDRLLMRYVQNAKPDKVTLQVIRNAAQGASTVASFEGQTLGDLLKTQPEAVAKYLLPAFEDLDIGFIYIRPADAAMAFAALRETDEKTKAAVDQIIAHLDSDAPEVRAAAQKELDALGPTAVSTLKKLDPAHMRLQARIVIQKFLEPYDAATASLKNRDFLALCLALQDSKLAALAKQHLETLTGKPLDFDPAAPREARQLFALKLLAASTPAASQTRP